MRMEPPPSPPVARLTSPPATAAEEPADEPPTVRPKRHGLCVTPWIFVTLTLSPPNSLAVVAPTGTAPPRSSNRSTTCAVRSATRSAKTNEPSLNGQPRTGSSSLIPVGTPPNGFETSAVAATRYAQSRSRWQNAFSREASIAANVASSSSTGERSPLRNASTSEQASPVQGASVTPGILAPRRGVGPIGCRAGPGGAPQQGGSAPSRGTANAGSGTGDPFGSWTATASTITNGPRGMSGAAQNAAGRP